METRRVAQHTGGKPPYWVITRSEERPGRRMSNGSAYRDILTFETGGGKVLPLFGTDERAAEFARAYELRGGSPDWKPTQAWAGELLMLLSAGGSDVGPCVGVSAVTFDPPEDAAQRERGELSIVGKRCFMDQLLGRGDRWWRGK